jgi:hypothetical protein
MVADLTEIGIGVYLRTTMGARHLADGLSALGTEHRLRFVHGSAVGAHLAASLLLLLLHLLGLLGHWLLPVGRLLRHSSPLLHLLGTHSSLRLHIGIIIVCHIVPLKNYRAKIAIIFQTQQKTAVNFNLRRQIL